MRVLLGFVLSGLTACAFGTERAVDIDPNTKIQGGADVRGSSANAGAGAQTDDRIESEKSRAEPGEEPRIHERGNVAGPDKSGPEKDKPISERKPRERELEDAAKGASARPQQ